MKNYVCILLLSICVCLNAQQNLVPNFSFETISSCPPVGIINNAVNWFQPNQSGCYSELFNTCQTSFPDVPNCYSGYQWPHTGNSFAGIVLFDDTVPSGYQDWGREYIEVGLTDSLKFNKKYCVGFYTNRGNWSEWAIKNIQAVFTHDSLLYNDPNYGYIPSVTIAIECSAIIYDSVNWVQVRDNYTALGGEKFLTVGNFSPGSQVIHHLVFPHNQTPNTQGFYLFDDISVYEQPDVFAGNDTLVHPGDTAHLGTPGRNDIFYSWQPTTGLSNASIANPVANPSVTTQYVLTVTDTNRWACNTIMYDTVIVTVGFAGINSLNNDNHIKVYPNPASNTILLNIESISNYQNSTITIQNTLGQTIKKLSFTKNIEVSDLSNGVYFLQIALSSGETYKTKFIKQ